MCIYICILFILLPKWWWSAFITTGGYNPCCLYYLLFSVYWGHLSLIQQAISHTADLPQWMPEYITNQSTYLSHFTAPPPYQKEDVHPQVAVQACIYTISQDWEYLFPFSLAVHGIQDPSTPNAISVPLNCHDELGHPTTVFHQLHSKLSSKLNIKCLICFSDKEPNLSCRISCSWMTWEDLKSFFCW